MGQHDSIFESLWLGKNSQWYTYIDVSLYLIAEHISYTIFSKTNCHPYLCIARFSHGNRRAKNRKVYRRNKFIGEYVLSLCTFIVHLYVCDLILAYLWVPLRKHVLLICVHMWVFFFMYIVCLCVYVNFLIYTVYLCVYVSFFIYTVCLCVYVSAFL